ncbi:MAG: bacterial ammonia monooxygenase, subunit AmoC, partial [Acidobacteriota bacterium]|nr:bacterial ammonia monooxygenase, subunit AmoC [Acidobacteriota bacterium]
MSARAEDIRAAVGSSGESGASPAGIVAGPVLRTCLPIMAVILVLALAGRWYQQWAAWEHGLDATTPAFETYWMTLFYVESVVIWSASLITWAWLWLTRDRNLDRLQPNEEFRRYMVWVGIIAAYVFALYFAASYFAEEDASWHQTVLRDTSFTPSHIILFYGSFPLYILLGGSMLIYAMTRLPVYAHRMSVTVLVAVVGPFLIMPNVAYNEWGHAFWSSEEIFALPLHWGFVVFGWAALAFGGLLVQVMNRLVVLLPKV